MNTFTEKELNILYFSLSRRVKDQTKVVKQIDYEKWPFVYEAELKALKEMQDLQEKLDDVIFGRNKFPEIVD